MNHSQAESREPPLSEPEAISKWARVYAQNRSLGIVVFMVAFVLLSAAIGGASLLGGVAYRSGNILLFWVSMAMLAPACGALVWFSVPRWGGQFQQRVVQRLYATEGNAAFSPPGDRKKTWGLILGGCFGACVIASVVMGFVVDIPTKYLQPISALYVVPFLVGVWFLMRPLAGYLALLWPALYAAHAILIVAGAPIFFTGRWQVLNVLIPMAGYGMLSGFVSHLYSRVALRQLKNLTQTDLTGPDQSGEPSEQ